MARSQDQDPDSSLLIEEIPERLDEQHIFTTKTLGFLIHPNIPIASPTLKVADIGTGTGIWLLDVAKSLPSTCQLTGFDMTSSAFPPPETWPPNVSLKIHDMFLPFPASEIGTYDVVAVRFVSSATPREEWARAIENLMTLLKPGGWLQWIDSCNFSLYNSVAGTSRAACQEIYDGLQPFRSKDDLVIGLMMREPTDVKREDVFQKLGLVDVHQDVFSTDKLQDPELQLRDKGTRNVITCFLGCLEELAGVEGSGWSRERIERVKEEARREIDNGVYHTLDQVCIVGRKVGKL
ncbi:S-adenosyl-L-methionine-dependent methyltransferase [Dactylonectria estremocensis]|uniref:S-adenosyl-L-methionine-dependent methyltransferase n=1 Tax=Dactylonectria estremocensis TaxID=1079267 RepID=A0A9P9DQS9_9HYPO|nr:S-adenosyl-L-methionine-dependent methyltransferase [Dactylonectria estremocensis]